MSHTGDPQDPNGQRPSILMRPMPRREMLRLMGLVSVGPVVLLACGSASQTPGATATGGPSASAPTATSAVPASASAAPAATPSPAASAPAAERLIRLGAYEAGVVLTWLPWAGAGQDFFWNWFTQKLFTIAPDGNILYDLAERHTLSADGLEYTFNLVQGAKWHDGTPVTARDVAFTYNTYLKAKAGSSQLSASKPFKGSQAVIDDNSKDAEGIVVVDDHTIKFIIDAPNAGTLATTFPNVRIAPAHAFEGVVLEDYLKQELNTNLAIGSGPYRMVEFKDKQFIRFEAYDEFVSATYKGRPKADKVTILVYPDPNAQLLSNEAGEIDFTYYRSPAGDLVERLRNIAGLHALPSKVGYNIFYSTNLNEPSAPLLKDKRVRQAMIWALERDTLVNDVLGGVPGIPEFMNQWSAAWANSDKLERYYPQNVDRAKQLLADAGWDGNAVLDVRHNPPKLSDDIPVILDMWEQVGIKAKLTPTPDDTFVADFYADPSDDDPTNGDTGPLYDIFFTYGFGTLDGAPWGSDSTLGTGRVWPNGGNSMRYSNPEWDTEFAAGLLAQTLETQAPHFKRCSEIFNDDLPYVPLYARVDYSSVSDKLKGPDDVLISHPSAGGIAYWNWTIEG